ncbi:PREDICTED: T-cell surface glycoprotein CD1e, membrane-associated [Chrysochloris asiatica]|uniref:T-cell surface glycoprotein CD1e, membrane-associated n=1 Tax=Chrysochloris asiatica TaxID=185453 RepID=A0A9B0TC69_CHRAS|nr:PREDICTED: T-cell surface glycoprotein CD1e, membrane-associated [Chrysochloris asiatica]
MDIADHKLIHIPPDPQDPGPPHSPAEEPLDFHLLQISSFVNHSWADIEGSGWLGELQTHGWDKTLSTIRFLRPWSQGNFSKKELKNLQTFFQFYFHGFIREVQVFASQFQFEYPFELQILSGCRIRAGETSESFLKGAYKGTDFLSFQGSSWQPSPGAGSRAQNVCGVLNNYRDVKEIVQSLLSVTCPRFLASILEAGKIELERQVKPEVWVSKGPSPGPGRLMLVCHVSGFHPKPVSVMWMRGDQEQPGTWQSGILPNADETWYLRVTLDVAIGEATGLYCRVKHSSLGGHDIIIHWDGYYMLQMLNYLTFVVILGSLIVLVFWFKERNSNENTLTSHVSHLAKGANTQGPRNSGNQLCSAQESWGKNRFLKKWKAILNQLY